MQRLMVKLLADDAVIPNKQFGDAGYDLYGLKRDFGLPLPPMQPTSVKTGVAIKIPEGYVGLIKERSSLGNQGIGVRGGVIDSSYTGELIVILHNLTNLYISLNLNRAIAQLLIIPVEDCIISIEDELPQTKRGEKGFGSTDKGTVFNQTKQTVLGTQYNGAYINECRG